MEFPTLRKTPPSSLIYLWFREHGSCWKSQFGKLPQILLEVSLGDRMDSYSDEELVDMRIVTGTPFGLPDHRTYHTWSYSSWVT
ncbi:hypothetical protein TNCV_2509011 [Trichonephila clavipes]|nr:hypothetical protein TNCV_2509011 [Trichonephila clavipes]